MNYPQTKTMNAPVMVKVGASRQVAIPKKIYDHLDLKTGDYLEVVVKNDKLVLTPKAFIERRLAEGLRDLKEGRTLGPFTNIDDAIRALEA